MEKCPVAESTTLYLVEHGIMPGGGTDQTVMNGWSDRDISAAGEKRMAQTARMLEGRNVGETYSSDLTRAVHSAEIIRSHLSIEHPNTERHGLRPMNVGLLAGLTHDETEGPMSDALARRWAPVPGGESYAKFLGRWQQELNRTIQEALGEDHACVYVTHSHNLGALDHLLSNGIEPSRLESPVSSGGIIALHIYNEGDEVVPEIIYNPGE